MAQEKESTSTTTSSTASTESMTTLPPLIGADGREVPRPLDIHGRPLPVYLNEEGLPFLGENGMPIAVRFDSDGNPIPLSDTGQWSPPKPHKNKNLCIVGCVDIFCSMVIVVLTGYYLFAGRTGDGSHTFCMRQGGFVKQKVNNCFTVLQVTLAIGAIGMIAAFLPVFATNSAKKTASGMQNTWAWLSIVLFLIQVGILILTPTWPAVVGSVICFIRCIACCIYMYFHDHDDLAYLRNRGGRQVVGQRYRFNGGSPGVAPGGPQQGGGAPPQGGGVPEQGGGVPPQGGGYPQQQPQVQYVQQPQVQYVQQPQIVYAQPMMQPMIGAPVVIMPIGGVPVVGGYGYSPYAAANAHLLHDLMYHHHHHYF